MVCASCECYILKGKQLSLVFSVDVQSVKHLEWSVE